MYVRLTKFKKSKNSALQVVKGYRQGSKVKQKIIASLGVIKSQKDLVNLSKLAENLIQKLKKQGLCINDKIEINKLIHKNTVYDGFGQAVNQLFYLAGFSNVTERIQGRKSFDLEEILKLIIVQRFDLPSSKLRTYERQEKHGFYGIDLQNIYRAMDAIEPYSDDFQKQAFETTRAYSSQSLECFFFDVTTLYFESVKQDEIRDFGFSKDQKYHSVQMVLALVVNSQGIPLAYEAFKGNLAETKTLIPVLKSLKKRFSLKNVTVVCDRGLASKKNIQALQEENFHYIIATKLRSISKKHKINDLSKYTPLPNQKKIPKKEKVLFHTMEHPQYENTLLIITYSPKRAKKDKKDRHRLIEKLQNKLSTTDNKASVKKIISNGGYKKFINVKEGSLITLNQQAIDKDAEWDGFHGIAISKDSKFKTTEALARYKELWHVEETFRIAKSTLKTRPVFHWAPKRIKSHILLCFLTLFLERFLELLLLKNNTPITPDRIRYALAGVHTTIFEDSDTNKTGRMQSKISEEAENIFNVLKLSTKRLTTMDM